VQAIAAHVLDLLGDVWPVQLGLVDQFVDGAPAQQVGLSLRPAQDVGVVEVVMVDHLASRSLLAAHTLSWLSPTIGT
jgi:hypothetical protein